MWVVDGDLISRKLDDKHSLEIDYTNNGLKIRVWEEPISEHGKRKIIFMTSISNDQLGYIIPKGNQ